MGYKSQVKYDDTLKSSIMHYQIHDLMLPFIGEHYEKHRILLVSESHYMPKNNNKKLGDAWYESSELGNEVQKNHHSRGVIQSFNHPLFKNIQKELKAFDDSLNFSFVTWYNFFQKPASHKDTIRHQLTKKDIEVSHEVFEKILNILKPKAVIFLSKLAFDKLQRDSKDDFVRFWSSEEKCHVYKKYKIPIFWAHHPNSLYWNRKNKSTPNGVQRFHNALNRILGESQQ
jgi:hypothetical protein